MESEWVRKENQEKLERQLRAPGLSSRQRETLHKLDRQWELRAYTLKTRRDKANKACLLGRFLGKPFEEAEREDLEEYLSQLARRAKPDTVASMKRFLKAFYKDLLLPDADQHPPIVSWIKLSDHRRARKLPEDLVSPEEVRRIAASTSNARDQALVMVLYESAGRASEILSLR